MRKVSLGIVSAFLLAPSFASAALTLNVESPTFRPGEITFIEVFFNELPPATDENLAVYALGLNLVGGNGVSFGPGPYVLTPTDHRFVFDGIPGATLEDLGSGPDRIRAFGSLPISVLEGVDITENNLGVLRVPITVAPGANYGLRPIVIELVEVAATEFVDEIGNVIPFVPVNGAVTYIPEPGALSLVGIAGVLFLRRRRA